MKNSNTLVFLNGKIYTVNDMNEWAEAIVVKDGRIIYVGGSEDARGFIDDGTEVIDLEGRMMLPGFVDNHCHVFLGSVYNTGIQIDFEWDVETTKNEIRRFVEEHPERDSFFGMGYSEWLFPEGQPDKELLDELCPDKPIILLSSGGHEGWCNTKALEAANITKDTPDPVPGFQYFKRDAQGNPTGLIKETKATNIIIEAIKPFSPELIKESLKRTFDEYASMGVTTLGDCGIYDFADDLTYEAARDMEIKGELKQRISGSTFCIAEVPFEKALPRLKELNRKYNSEMFSIHTLKVLNDGTAEAHTASLSYPYCDNGAVIPPVFEGAEFDNMGIETAKAGFDIHVHAIGDRAIDATLAMAKAVREAGCSDTRITNAHTQMVRPDMLPLFSKYNVLANTTPVWFFDTDLSFLSEELLPYQFNFHSLLNAGATVCFGSDFPADYFGREPLKGIEMGLTRRLYGRPEASYLTTMDESLSIEQTIKGYTKDALYTHRLEDVTGSIEVGKYADLVVLERNIFDEDPYSIHKIPVSMTFMNGKMTYCRDRKDP